MSVWQTLGTLILAIGLMEVMPGKKVTAPDGATIGIASDIELDLILNKIEVIVKHQGRWNRIPYKQIATVTDKVTLLDGWLPGCTDSEAGTLA